MKISRLVIFSLLLSTFLFGASTGLDAVFEHYFGIQAALANDSLKDASSHAKELMTSVPQKGKDEKTNEQLATIRTLSERISAAKSLDQARKPFEELSTLMIALKAENKVPASEYFCPMVKKSWLQKGDKIQNPYLGKSMQECGEKKK